MASVTKKPNGWLMRWRVKDPLTLEVKQTTKLFKGTSKKEALKLAREYEEEARKRPVTEQARSMTVAEYINDQYLPWHKGQVVTRTYRTNVERVAPLTDILGQTALSALTGLHIDNALARLKDNGVSDTMRRAYFSSFRTAIRQARKWKLIAVDVCEDATPPKAPPKRQAVAGLDDSKALSEAFLEDGQTVAAHYITVMSETGMRPAEALALQWHHVDLDAGVLRVEQALEEYRSCAYRIKDMPKNTQSIRTIHLPRRSITALRALRSYRAERKLRKAGYNPTDLVFPNKSGNIWGVNAAARVIRRKAVPLGLSSGSYSRRHGMASEMLNGKIPVTVVAARMGHSNTATTLSTYAHALPDAGEQAVAFFDDKESARS